MFAIAGILCICFVFAFFYERRFIRYQEPTFLTFHELQKLYKNPHPGGLLGLKLARFETTPIISNEAYFEGARPPQRTDPKLGPYLTLASWNIGEEELFHLKDIIKVFSSADQFRSLINSDKVPEGSPGYKEILRQRERLAHADIIVLQEVNVGVKRSEYRDEAKDFAQALKMNYTFGDEQLEIDPVILGLEKIYYKDGVTVDKEGTALYAADPARYKGALGNAVFSRYPIKKVRVFQLKHVPYDWYVSQKENPGFIEKVREKGGEILLETEFTRSVRVGTQIYFRVDLDVPGLPENTLTVINIHLEINCTPKEREVQLAEILSYMKGIKHPVVMVGDYNAAPDDLSSTSIKRIVVRTIKDPTTWLSAAVTYLLPQALIINSTRFVGNFTKNLQDPLASDISVIFPNPLHALFAMIQNYRFKDGGAFDFRGDSERSINGKGGALANSNERGFKGFKTTWRVQRPISFIGKYRLDWVFVKSALKDPYDKTGPYRLAPHFGETLEELNTSLKVPVSDHHPNVVDIPLQEPRIK
jgi:endonuclease/exonuclease/phosphatase family metal-dependent hydrolase